MDILRSLLIDDLSQKTQSGEIPAGLEALLSGIAVACQEISDKVRYGIFDGHMGSAGSDNPQGETQKKLDIVANDIFVAHCSKCDGIAGLVSEEVDDVIWLKDAPKKGDYLVYFDPLDGSSNIDVDLSVGSIFSIVALEDDLDTLTNEDALIAGSRQICAGYAIYGPSTMFVYTVGAGVAAYSQAPDTGEFALSHPDMRVPEDTQEFAINTSRSRYWHGPVQAYVADCLAGKDGPRGKNFNMRWTASMVADVHRILMRGGVFLYPADTNNAHMGGKLRLLYEANPMAMIVENAGGAASTGNGRILDVAPTSHHQRVPVILGSKSEVAKISDYHLSRN